MKRKKRRSKEEAEALAKLLRLAVDRHQRGAHADAERYYLEVLAEEPDHAAALNFLGVLRLDQGDAAAAIKLLKKSIAIAPQVAASQMNLGKALAAEGHDEAAVHALQNAARLDPRDALVRYTLGVHHLRHRRHEPALAALRRVLELEPANARASYLVAGLSGGHLDAQANQYIADLFDDYAAIFDEHLVNRLEYRVPAGLAAMVVAAAAPAERSLTVLDLGCGTGMCGTALRGLARRIVGGDLSPRMVEAAGRRGVYDELHTEDLLATLARGAGDVDLVVAADVFIYVGALEAPFAACAAALRPGGLFAFSTERGDADGFRLSTSFRYAHADAYVREVGQSAGFAVAAVEETVIRTESEQPIPGFLYLLRRR